MENHPTSHSATPLHDALLDLVRTIREKDPAGQNDALIRVNRAARSFDPISRRLGVRGANLDEVRNEILFKIYRSLHRLPEGPASPVPWAKRVARCVAIDWIRARNRESGLVYLDPAAVEKTLASEDHLEAPPDRPSAEDLAHGAEEYALRASRLRRPRGHQIRAWYTTHVCQGSAREFGAAQLDARGAPASEATVWKWTERGARLVVELAAADEHTARADLMRRAATVRGPSPRGPRGAGSSPALASGALPAAPPAAAPSPTFGEYERRAVLLYAFTSGLHRSTGVERVVALRCFARALAGAAPVNAAAHHGADVAAAIAREDPDPRRAARMTELARHVLAQRP